MDIPGHTTAADDDREDDRRMGWGGLRVVRLRYASPAGELEVGGFRALLCEPKADPPGMILGAHEARRAHGIAGTRPSRLEVLSDRPATVLDAHKALGINALRWSRGPEGALPLPTAKDLVGYLEGPSPERGPGTGEA